MDFKKNHLHVHVRGEEFDMVFGKFIFGVDTTWYDNGNFFIRSTSKY